MKNHRLRPTLFAACLLVTIWPLAAQERSHAGYVVRSGGIGPVKIGMTVQQAAKALRIPLERGEGYEESCYYVTPKHTLDGVDFMVTGKRIARVDINDKKYTTEKGARIGDREDRIKKLYKGAVRVSPHKYVDGHYLTVSDKTTGFQIVFETDGKRVTSYRAGRAPEVQFIEGCS